MGCKCRVSRLRSTWSCLRFVPNTPMIRGPQGRWSSVKVFIIHERLCEITDGTTLQLGPLIDSTSAGKRFSRGVTRCAGTYQPTASTQLNLTVNICFLQDDIKENVTSSELTFVPTTDDNGKSITCKAENPQMPTMFVEANWILKVVCESRYILIIIIIRLYLGCVT